MHRDNLEQIGRIVVNFASLEMHLAFVVWGMISENQEIWKATTTGMSMKALLNLFSSLCAVKILDSETLMEFENVAKKVLKINDRRNLIVHSFWTINDENKDKVGQVRFKTKWIKGVEIIPSDIKTTDLLEIADEIRWLCEELIQLGMKYRDITGMQITPKKQ